MKLKRLLTTIGLSAALGAPVAANAQFFFNNPAGGFFTARPFVFTGPMGRPVISPPIGGVFGGSGFVMNPYARQIGAGPIPTGFNSGFFPNGGVGLGFTNAGFPGAGTAMNPGFDPRFGSQAAIMNGMISANSLSRFNNNAMLNPFFDPSGGFFNPSAQTGAVNPFAVGAPGMGFNPGVVSNNGFGSTVLNAGIQPGAAANVMGAVPDASGLVTAAIQNGRVALSYNGDTSIVRSITYSLLDANGRPLQVQITNTNPPVARLRLSRGAVFYRVSIEYVNGQNQVVEGRI